MKNETDMQNNSTDGLTFQVQQMSSLHDKVYN
jgi:hypothetical protein